MNNIFFFLTTHGLVRQYTNLICIYVIGCLLATFGLVVFFIVCVHLLVLLFCLGSSCFKKVWSCFWHVALCYMMHILLLYWILNLNKCTRYDTTQICCISWSSRVSYNGKREHLWWKLMSCFYCFGDGFHCSVLLWEASEIALRWKLINKIIPCLRSHRPCMYLSDFRYVLILVSQRLASWSISFYDIGLVAPLVLLSFFLCTNHYH